MLQNIESYKSIEKSLQKLETLDKFYYPKENYNKRQERFNYKSFCLDNNFLDLIYSVGKQQRLLSYYDLNTLNYNDYLLDKIGLTAIVESLRLQESTKKRNIRLRQRIEKIIKSDNCLFLTFTFNNDYIDKVKDSNKRIYVVRWLKKYCIDYVGNVDYGEKNGRIHFHCVVSVTKDIDSNTWKYGAINFKRIYNKDSKSMALYVNKLTNHALKESAKCQYLIYPKKVLTTSHN